MSARLERALLLHNQGRYDLAEKEVRLALAEDPDDPLAHAILSQCLTQLKQFAAAVEEAQLAIACGPSLPLAHYTLAFAFYHRNHYPEAEAAVSNAILLDPTDPDYFALLAAIHAERESWVQTLHAAEKGLENDPEHGWCGNLRAMALVKLGRQAEAGRAVQEALARDPDDAFTHATRGWGLLHEGNARQALEHFRESLRLEPNLEYARAGMIEAMKARYWLYRRVLGYFLWLSRLSPQARWGLVIALLVLSQVVSSMAKNDPALRPVLEPVLIAYVAFVMTTWTAVPLSNLFLRLNRFGRLALSPEQRRASFWVGLFVLLALAGVGWGLFGPREYSFLGWPVALGFMILLIPISGTCSCQPGWPRWVMLTFTLGMVAAVTAAVVLLGVAIHHDGRDNKTAIACAKFALNLLRGNVWAGLISSLLANWLASVQPRL